MKGVVSILELLITGIILILAFVHFFPQYTVRTNWSPALLDTIVTDSLSTIDNLDRTYDYAIDNCQGSGFETFMENTFSPDHSNEVYVWWKEVEDFNDGMNEVNCPAPYFTEAKKETMIDVFEDSDDNFYVYSLSLGMGYPY
ncbi:MAG: hypothetical protein GF368_04780 [Candidatus Aenigmarchaeota archaeon]|nr:hypothetical protein [Candidatus Aenigmarchaeota archaeon]